MSNEPSSTPIHQFLLFPISVLAVQTNGEEEKTGRQYNLALRIIHNKPQRSAEREERVLAAQTNSEEETTGRQYNLALRIIHNKPQRSAEREERVWQLKQIVRSRKQEDNTTWRWESSTINHKGRQRGRSGLDFTNQFPSSDWITGRAQTDTNKAPSIRSYSESRRMITWWWRSWMFL